MWKRQREREREREREAQGRRAAPSRWGDACTSAWYRQHASEIPRRDIEHAYYEAQRADANFGWTRAAAASVPGRCFSALALGENGRTATDGVCARDFSKECPAATHHPGEEHFLLRPSCDPSQPARHVARFYHEDLQPKNSSCFKISPVNVY